MTGSVSSSTPSNSPTCCSSRWRTSGPLGSSTRSRSSQPSTRGRSSSTPRVTSSSSSTPGCWSAWRAAGGHRHDLPQGAEQHPGPGQAQAAHRRPHRQGELEPVGYRHQGRCLRGPAEQGCLGQGIRCRPVLHTARSDPGDRRCHPTDRRRHRHRPRLRHRRLPPRRSRVRRTGLGVDDPDPASQAAGQPRQRLRTRRRHCSPRGHEPAPSRHGHR
jgi:hypothetical protein